VTAAPPDDPFAVLGVAPDADEATVRAAYRRAVREHPPDRDPAGFERVRAAYERVRDPVALAYSLLDPPPPSFPPPRHPDPPGLPSPANAARDLLRLLLATGLLSLEEPDGR